nr:CDP-glycerol glycerophosphotransferase family protein [Ornithinimicrobium cryptoxanthini]
MVTVEWLDPQPGAVDIALRINLAGHRFASRPPWQFRVAVTEPPHAGEVTGSDPVGLVERIDASGTRRWEWLVARVPLSGVPTGDYRVELSLSSRDESHRVTRIARPSNGSLANARTVRLAAPSAGARAVRYYLHAPDHGRETRLWIGHGSGPVAELVWGVRITAADLGYILGGAGGRRMRALRLLKLVTAPIFLGREVWLLGERADEAQDNGMHLFRYLRAHRSPRRHVYYVLSRTSPHYSELRRLGNVVPHSSRRHQLLMLHATVVANAHSTHHMIPRHWKRKAFLRRLAWRIGALQVFLQHGVHLSPEAVKRGTTGYDVILTSARGETRALRAASGYDAQIEEVGMPRFDSLTPTPPSRTILMMPTWRRYLWSHARGQSRPDQDQFAGSTYERFMTDLLTSARLQTMLEAFDYRLVLVPHHNVAEHLTDAATAGDRITVVAATGMALQDMVRRCDVFITDHSSVHFDAAYVGTPVIYARFDREEFESRHAAPSWFDFERDGFGPVVTTVDGTLDELDALLARGCTPDPLFARRAATVFTHHDQGNSRRVVATIERRLRTIRATRGGASR